MRWRLIVACVVSTVGIAAAQQPAPDAARVLADMRQALGGEAALNAVQTFSVGGSLRANMGERLVDWDIELLCELPDKCIRERTQTGILSAGITMTDGYSGSDPIRRIDAHGRPGPKDMAVLPMTPEMMAARKLAAANRQKEEFARLTLALFGASLSAFPLELTSGGPDQLDGRAMEAIEAKGARGFSVRLLVDAQRSDSAAPEQVNLDMQFAEQGGEGPTPYEVLLHAAMIGDSTRFTRQDNIEETWRICGPLLEKPPRILPYKPGTWGPKAADRLVKDFGGWREPWTGS